MLSIWKFVRSSSISGLSYTTNPNCSKMSAISPIASMLGWSVPRRNGRPGVVTSTVSATSRALSSVPRTAWPRSARAASMAARTVFAIAPTRGRSSAGSPPIPRRTPVRRPFLPRTSSSSASIAAASGAAAIDSRASSRSASRSRVRSARSTVVLGCEMAPGIANPRSSWTSRARRTVSVGRSGPGQAPLAASTIRPNVALSRTARSARILRSISISARLRPLMNWP